MLCLIDWSCSMNLIIASNNKGKIREVSEILLPLGYKVISQSEAGYNLDVEETGTTFEENAALKARALYKASGCAVIADDSGLEVDALNNAPGVYSARYAGENATDKDRYTKLLKELENVEDGNRKARFVCVIHYISADGVEKSFRGECYGEIGRSPKGENGFGYDPVFYIIEKSIAQLTEDEKNKNSHRGAAILKLYEFLKSEEK